MPMRGTVLWAVSALALALARPTSLRAEETAPRGHLLIIGGGARGDAVLAKLVELAGGARARIVVFPMASDAPEETGRAYVEELRRNGAGDVFVLNVNREQADTDAALARLDRVTGVFFSG